MGERGGDYIPPDARDPKSHTEKREYSFEEGLLALDACIRQKLTEKDLVFVAVIGSSSHVGKSQLCKELEKRFSGSVPMVWDNNVENLGDIHRDRLKDRQERYESSKAVVVIGESFIGHFLPGNNLHRTLDFILMMEKKHQKNGHFSLPDSYDVIVAISSKDAPFEYPEVVQGQADVYIVNEHAKQKVL